MSEKDTCPKCGSDNVTITKVLDDETGEWVEDLHDGKCNDCGWDYVVVDL